MWKCCVFILLWPLDPSMSRWRTRFEVEISAWTERGREIGLVGGFHTNLKILKKAFFKSDMCISYEHGSIPPALQTVCLSLEPSCGIQEHSSNLLFSGTEACLSQDLKEYSWNTSPLFTQLWNTKQKNISEHDGTSGSSELHRALMWKWQTHNIYKKMDIGGPT